MRGCWSIRPKNCSIQGALKPCGETHIVAFGWYLLEVGGLLFEQRHQVARLGVAGVAAGNEDGVDAREAGGRPRPIPVSAASTVAGLA